MNTSASSSSRKQANAGKRFIDFVTYGTGLVTRARFVKGGRLKTPALYCTISIPLDERGVENGRWTNFDVRVLGHENIKFIENMIPAVADGKRPRVHFSIGDAYADPYWKHIGSDKRARAQFKGRLLRVSDAGNDPQRPLTSHGLAYVNSLDYARNCLNVGVIHGSVDELERTYIATTLQQEPNAEMQKALDSVKAGIIGKAKVLACIVLRDLQCQAFVFRDGSKNAGQLGTNVNAHLDTVRWVRVEGEKIYMLPKADVTQETELTQPQQETVKTAPEQVVEDNDLQWKNMLATYPGLDD